MRLLLDTHVLLWWLRDSPRLGPRARAVIAAPENEAMVSIASFWEIAIKSRIGQIAERGSAVLREAARSGFRVLAIDDRHLAYVEELAARGDHNDPFDHLILAQAVVEQATLVTGDRKLKAYEVVRLAPG